MQPEQIPVNQYNGNNSDTTFDFDFFIENSNQLKVTLTDYDGTQTVLTHNVDYTIHEVGNKYGSYITYPYVTEQYQSTHDVLGYDATTEQAQMLTLELVIPIEQPSEYTNSNTLAIKNIEKSLDYGIRVDQMLDAKINRLDSNQSDFESNIIEEMNDFMVEESVARQTFESTMQQAQSDFETTIVGRQTELENTVSSTLSTQNQQIQTLTSDTESSLETMNAQLTTMSENMTNFENSITAQETSHQTAVSEYLEDITAAKNEISGDFSDLQENYASFKEEVNTALDGKADESDLSDVAFSGSYDDLSNKPVVDQIYDWTSHNAQSGVAIEGILTEYPQNEDLSEVAFSGNYNDLSDKPSIPDAQIQSDWRQSDNTKLDYIKNKPTIPAAQIQSDWNQSDNSAADFIKNKPYIPSGVVIDQTYDGTSANAQSGVAIAGELSNYTKTSGLSTVATSGSYNDLRDKPTIPTGEIYIAEYNVTNYSDINTAYNSGKTIYCKYVLGNNNVNFYSLVRKDTVNNAYIFSNIIDTLSDKLTINSSNVWSYSGTALASASELLAKQDRLVSGTNIKTVNNQSILGGGNIDTSEVFIAEYGVTSFADIQTAYNAGKSVFCKDGNVFFMLNICLNPIADFSCIYTGTNTTVLFRRCELNSGNTVWSKPTTKTLQDKLNYTPENQSKKVTSLSSSSTDTQYPSAKCVYDTCQSKVTITYEE